MTHTSTEQPELLPCPFCGGDVKHEVWSDRSFHKVECQDCGLDVDYCNSYAELVEFWNRRDPQPQAQRVPLSDEWIEELMGLVSRYGNLNYQECDADYREHQTKSERYAQDQRDTFSAIESKLRTIGITQEKHHGE